LGAFTALIGTAGALFAIVGNPFAPDPREEEAKKSPAAVAAYQIAKCRTMHGLGAATVVVKNWPAAGVPTRRSFERCEWPPPVSTSADGYTLIEDRITAYAGKGAAEPFNALHTLTAPCDRLAVSFVLYHMTSRVYREARIRSGPVFLVTSIGVRDVPVPRVRELKQVPIDVQLPPPEKGGFFVLLNGHMEILHAKCAPS